MMEAEYQAAMISFVKNWTEWVKSWVKAENRIAKILVTIAKRRSM